MASGRETSEYELARAAIVLAVALALIGAWAVVIGALWAGASCMLGSGIAAGAASAAYSHSRAKAKTQQAQPPVHRQPPRRI